MIGVIGACGKDPGWVGRKEVSRCVDAIYAKICQAPSARLFSPAEVLVPVLEVKWERVGDPDIVTRFT